MIGVDIDHNAIDFANKTAVASKLNSLVHFYHGNANQPLQFPDQVFDIIICIDAIAHFPDRQWVFQEWNRLLRAGGIVLFTDATVITGLLSYHEIAVRSSVGFFMFSPPGEDERLLHKTGFELIQIQDVTESVAEISSRRYNARSNRLDGLTKIEGELAFEKYQQYLSMAHRLAHEQRLSRFVFLARKPL